MPSPQPYGTVPDDIKCRVCGYNLRGLVPEERCPECGTFVTESLRQTIRPGKERRIRDWLIWLAAVLCVFWLLCNL